jgi:CheY-like chemotaxis protein
LLFHTFVQRLARSATSTSTAAAAVSPATRAAAATLHVLVADANAATLAARAEQLAAAGLRVSMAHSSFEAIVKASCFLPDLILLDGSLSGLDAATTSELLTTCPATAHIPVFRLAPGRRVPRHVLSAAMRPGARV